MAHLYDEIWDKVHLRNVNMNNGIKYDDWIVDFDCIIDEVNSPIIDLGCGTGNNTLYLVEKKKKVISCDYSREALNIVKEYIPNSETRLFDMTEGLPFENNYTDLIIADLCLHYFSELTTANIIKEIKRVLKPDGYLMFRVNSVNDTNYGAMQGEKIEENFFLTTVGTIPNNEMTKRFFDKEHLLKFFKGWDIEYMNEETMGRYEKPKRLWRCVVRNNKK